MKELSKEEKAKRYDEALEELRGLLEGIREEKCKILEEDITSIFHELQENEDERIRKAIHIYFDWLDGRKDYQPKGEYTIRDMIAWLEKQSEQKPTGKVEPKFNIGDWIIDVQGVSANQIIGYEDDSYYIETSCSKFYLPMKLTEKNYRLWTIADAKDGDVLCCESGWTCIFKALDNHTNTFSSYSFMDKTGWFCETGSEAHTLEKAFIKAYNGNIFPATKEQRELLFSKMKEAGYEWDANHKQLKKIEQKPAWSEEDEEILRTIISDGIRGAEFDMLQIDWLKSLKDRYTWKPSCGQKQEEKPRYNIGDVICDKSCTTLNKEAQPNMEIVDIKNGMYICDKGSFPVSQQDEYELVSKKIDTKLNDHSVSNELREASFAHARKEIKNPTCPDNEEFELAYTFEEGAKWEAAQKSIRSKEDKKVFDEVNSFLKDLKKLK